jgi:Dyp-type peroxidase family
MAQLELDDIQGLIARGYGNLPAARYLVLRIDDGALARAWLRDLTARVTRASQKPQDAAIHVAFTSRGLTALGLDEETLAAFSREFWEGMAHPHRARHVLSDRGESDPERWRWGKEDTHVLLLLYASDGDALETLHASAREGYQGVAEIQLLETFSFERAREHFGFNDGIAQPIIMGLSKTGPASNTIAPGEFILGYRNQYEKIPLSPTVPLEQRGAEMLPRVVRDDGVEAGDLGRNGTYLVFRQLEQDVQAFWRFIDEATHLENGESDHAGRIRMAAKMVGRWPSGAPLTLCPEKDDAAQGDRDDFSYRPADAQGHFCPKGAHIRRTNPRDALAGKPEESIEVSNRHRLLRRGRPYGAALSRSLDVDEILRQERTHEVGLHFICLNADIGRQFEFVQHTWINNAKFAGLYTDADPLMGHSDELQGTFTLQGAPVRQRITGMKRFVEVRGGAYFFLPGLKALEYIASL